MPMIVHFNGRFVPRSDALVSVFDRGFLFGDGVYEGVRAFGGTPVWADLHIARMSEGLASAGIDFDPRGLADMTHQLLDHNSLTDAFVYWQVTRGTPTADQPVRSRIPAGPMPPTVFAYASAQKPLAFYRQNVPAIRASIVPDCRWLRASLKSTSLLGNVLCAMEAAEHDSAEAILVRDGLVTEACACNVVLALPSSAGTRLVTPSLDSAPMLAGITRHKLCELEPAIEQRPVTQAELAQACEIMVVGTNAVVTSVTHLDQRPVGEGKPGPQARRLLSLYADALEREVQFGRRRDLTKAAIEPTTARPTSAPTTPASAPAARRACIAVGVGC